MSYAARATPAPDVAALVAEAAAEHPQRLAVVEARGRGLTWSELDEEIDRLTTGLGEVGIVAGTRVMVAMGNRLEFVTSYLAVLRAQAVAVPVNPASTASELARIIGDAGVRLVLADPEGLPSVRAAVATVEHPPRVVVVAAPEQAGESAYEDLLVEHPRAVPPLPDPEKLAVLLYTSGTSGLPRAAMLTHRALLANVAQVAAVDPPMIHADDVVLGLL
ncbi:MAG: long-chain fatty acid--CoA ligase, partial [Nocardioidaceae bacterium]|nr:long-chain fatty acid--CoA ligase [Nocardioidaceae bacterium]